jgi:hypothetical protein
VKGKRLHYSAAIAHLRVFVSKLARLMGPVSEDLYDQPMPPPPGLLDLSVELGGVLQRYGDLGLPMWPTVPSSGYAAFLCGAGAEALCSLTWDASHFGPKASAGPPWPAGGTCPARSRHCASGF